MTTIQLAITDDIVHKYGVEAIIYRLQQFLEAERLKILADEVSSAIKSSGEDSDMLFEEARKKAWSEYKGKNLKNILP